MLVNFFATRTLAGFGLGVSAGLLLPLLARVWSQRFLATAGPRTRSYAFLALASLAILSTTRLINEPHEAEARAGSAVPGATTPMAASTNSGSMAAASSMEAATAILSARLASSGGSDADWELLAQSFDFLGRAADAARARQHKVATERSLEDAVSTSARMLGLARPTGTAQTRSGQGDELSLISQAEGHRRKREFKQACEVYSVIVSRGAMTADTWADYADAQASVAGRLAGEPARAIAAALALDPRHAKALWLNASLAHEQRRYAEAVESWRRLLAIVPPGSSDARIVEANIVEAKRLAAG
jgi:cytochrome c-type biogenesis protein CcmH/NrfG